MMESFFDIQRDGSNVFDEFSIVKNHPDFCRKWMHQYPVIFITLKEVDGTTFEAVYAMLQGVIAELFIKYSFLETDSRVNPADAATFHRLKFKEKCETKEEKNKCFKEIKTS